MPDRRIGIGGSTTISVSSRTSDESGEDIFGEPCEVELKGLSGRYRLYEVLWDGQARS